MSSALETLASTVYAKAVELAEISKQHGINPSIDDPVASDLSSVTPLATRNELIQAAKDLLYLAMGPTDHVLSLAWSVSQVPSIQKKRSSDSNRQQMLPI